MKLLAKIFIYLVIIVIIAILNIADVAHAKSLTGNSNSMKMDDPPEKVPEFESSISRIRREVDPNAAAEDDIPKEEPKAESRLRTRRQAPPSESDVPQAIQNDVQLFRAKRQIPSPPQEFPMPPM